MTTALIIIAGLVAVAAGVVYARSRRRDREGIERARSAAREPQEHTPAPPREDYVPTSASTARRRAASHRVGDPRPARDERDRRDYVAGDDGGISSVGNDLTTLAALDALTTDVREPAQETQVPDPPAAVPDPPSYDAPDTSSSGDTGGGGGD